MATRKPYPHNATNIKKGRKGVPSPKESKLGTLRIIGGQWRSRRLSFPSVDGLRPTTDRVRETLFNWLSPTLPGAHCLDLFTGSGALGLEALSREAGTVTFIDKSSSAISALKNNLQLLKASNAHPINSDSLIWLKGAEPEPAFDIIFIDPPFRRGLITECVELIQNRALVKTGSYIYIELEKETPLPSIPKHWALHREKEAGQVRYMLFIVGELK